MLNYGPDPKKISLDQIYSLIGNKDLLPGRRILRENPQEHLKILQQHGINNAEQLLDALKSGKHIERLSQLSGISSEYLRILKREAGSYFPTPVTLKNNFCQQSIIERLRTYGIINTKDLLKEAGKRENREKLSHDSGISIEDLQKLTIISDLMRINGVGPVFAEIIYFSGITGVEDFKNRDVDSLLEMLHKTNRKTGLTGVNFSAKDIRFCMEYSCMLEKMIDL